MDEIMSVLRKIQNDLNEQKTAILENGNIVTQQVTENINIILEEKFKTWEEKFNNISEKIENQEKRLFFLKNKPDREILYSSVLKKLKPHIQIWNRI